MRIQGRFLFDAWVRDDYIGLLSFMRAAIIYILAVFLGNLTGTAFIPFPVFGQVAVGTLIFGVTFTQRDRMHHQRGRKFVYRVIALTAVLTLALLLSAAYWWGRPLEGWFTARGMAWCATSVDSLATSGPRIFLASFLAIILAETADTEIYHKLRKRSWAVRVLSSNVVSVPLDSITFNVIAFAGIFAPMLLVQIIFGEVVIKYSISALYALKAEKGAAAQSESLPAAASER
jgi:uncharacterized integral membrane protein (TIGR00697 family)